MKNWLYFLLFFPCCLSAQTTYEKAEYIDKITLKDKSVFLGKILEISEKGVTMRLVGGQVWGVQQKNVKRIEQQCLNCQSIIIGTPTELAEQIKETYDLKLTSKGRVELVKKYSLKEKGRYFQGMIGLVSAENGSPGYTTSFAGGYMYRRIFGVGGGVGIQSYEDYNQTKQIMPIFVEAKSFLTASRKAPFVSFKTGYGFPINTLTNTQNTPNYQGGVFINPALGFRLGANEGVNMVAEFSFITQYTREAFVLNDINQGVEWREYVFRRWAFNLGVLF